MLYIISEIKKSLFIHTQVGPLTCAFPHSKQSKKNKNKNKKNPKKLQQQQKNPI